MPTEGFCRAWCGSARVFSVIREKLGGKWVVRGLVHPRVSAHASTRAVGMARERVHERDGACAATRACLHGRGSCQRQEGRRGLAAGANGEVVLCTGELGAGCERQAREGEGVFHTWRDEMRVERACVHAGHECVRGAHAYTKACACTCACVSARARVRVRARARLHARARSHACAFTRVCVQVCKCRRVCACAAAPPRLPFPAWVRRGARGRSTLPRGSGSSRAALLGSPAPLSPLVLAAAALTIASSGSGSGPASPPPFPTP